MESLLPSEIARLVLGYLEDQKCQEAARSFLEMSPDLQECRSVRSNGGRFGTRVNGFTLADILEKFCAANAIIHERLSKVSESEELKHCGDLLQQLRFLVDNSRGQRFVVNINVPPTPSQALLGSSPVISSSVQKSKHQSSAERSKHRRKTHSVEKRHSAGRDPLETTQLENLPGHSDNYDPSTKKCQEATTQCSSSVADFPGAKSPQENSCDAAPTPTENGHPTFSEKCTTSTDTQELMQYTNSEVQTVPYGDSESETTNEPVENLSLLTKELLNRTELQERIAENINKAILPTDVSLRDMSMSESFEMNTSIMTELNNAIKSVVTATESDPVFAQFLDEIIGPSAEHDTSPDEDADHCQGSPPQPPDLIPKPADTSQVPLKNRLRSSANQQPAIRGEEAGWGVVNEEAALEDVNAAAILSIINANSNPATEETEVNVDEKKDEEEAPKCVPMDEEKSVATSSVKTAAKKGNVRRSRKSRPKPVAEVPLISEEEIMAMPTLIVCSKEEASTIMARTPVPAESTLGPLGYCTSQFLPIAPKPANIPKSVEKIYLRTVTVPTTVCQVPADTCPRLLPMEEEIRETRNLIEAPPTIIVDNPKEKITLYSEENKAIIDNTAISSLRVEEPMTQISSLSPFLKFNDQPTAEIEQPAKEDKNYDVIAKRTPRTLMKSRSKNNRLSLSTPRRRHVRALDFNTPSKSKTARRLSANDSNIEYSPKGMYVKKMCRTSLFKSPPFSPTKKPRESCKIPIATRLPTPKLMGGWEKYTGVGMILGSSSPSSASCSPQKIKKPETKSWDEDLRKSLMVPNLEEPAAKKPAEKRKYAKGNREKSSNEEKQSTSASNIDDSSAKSTTIEKRRGSAKSGEKSEKKIAEKSIIEMDVEVEEKTTNRTVKKYAKLKTIRTSVAKETIVGNAAEKINGTLPDMLDLETPRKFEQDFGIPPTPRVLSPGSSNLTTPFVAMIHQETTKFQGFVTTPEFPPTPSINLTPKQSSNDDTGSKIGQEGVGSTYYQPSSELKDPRLPKKDESRHDLSLPLPEMILELSGNPACQSQKVAPQDAFPPRIAEKFEITQFEVIKENLPREETLGELQIPSNERSEEIRPLTPVEDSVNTTSSTLDNSSDSDDTSSSSSDSSSSSSSDSSALESEDTPPIPESSPAPLPPAVPASEMYVEARKKIEDSGRGIEVTENERERSEESPQKLLPLVNEEMTETPAKNDDLLDEAVISETPSTSKKIETTNLNTKFSAIMTSKETQLPKVISVQTLTSKVAMKNCKVPLNEVGQTSAKSVAQMSNELEEKRLRMVAKIKGGKSGTLVNRTRMRAGVTIVRTRKKTAEAEKKEEDKKLDKLVDKKSSKKRSAKEHDDWRVILMGSGKTDDTVSSSQDHRQQNGEKKTSTKSKVDLIKRDLFSDEESNDQRTTRSQTQRNSEARETLATLNNDPRERLPGVLECLDLVPAVAKVGDSLDTSQRRHAEFHFIYDNTVSTKRRKRKFSNSELEFPVQVELSDENYRKCPKLMKATAFEEIFNISPPRRRRVLKDTGKKDQVTIPAGKKNAVKACIEEPLAASSPLFKASAKSQSPKKQNTDLKKKSNPSRRRVEPPVDNPKTRKRKASWSRDSTEQTEKKARAVDPQLLLKKMDLDKFLSTVHGPVLE